MGFQYVTMVLSAYDAVVSLCFLHVPERIIFKVAVQTFGHCMVTLSSIPHAHRHPFSAQTPVLSHRQSVRSY